MFKKMIAIAAAASCAGLIVSFVPGFAPEVAAGTSGPVEASAASVAMIVSLAELAAPPAADIRNAVDQNLRNGSRAPKIICEQSWPHYEPSCLRDTHAGAARIVRVIAADHAAASATAAAARDAAQRLAQSVEQNLARTAARRAHAKR